MSIVTGTGDDGFSSLFGGARVAKNHPRLAAYGTTDEAMSAIGLLRSMDALPDDVNQLLKTIQQDLFVLGSDLASPDPSANVPRVSVDMVTRLEDYCADSEQCLPKLESFLVPTGTPSAAMCYWIRTVVRRAERDVTEVLKEGGANKLPLIYLNRLSDLLFLLARKLNESAGVVEETWEG